MSEFRRVIFNGVEQTIAVARGHAVGRDGRAVPLDSVQHLVPMRVGKVVCVQFNYRSRLEEVRRQAPSAPAYFWKPPSCLNAHKASVIRPKGCRHLNYEGEFAVVVGRTTRNITPQDAPAHIFGYTIANDMALHDFRDADHGMVKVKGSDTLGPVGPGVVTDWDFRDKRLVTRVDGNIVQDANTSELVWNPYYLLADLSRSITFEAGDMILTGTPANSGPIEPGSTVSVEVEGLGCLQNTVVESEMPVPGWASAETPATQRGLSSGPTAGEPEPGAFVV